MAELARGNPARWWLGRSCGSASRAPMALFISPLRRWAARVTLLFLVLLLGGGWYLTNPTRVSRLSASLLSRVLGGNVTVRNGHLSLAGTLRLSGVEVRADGAPPTEAPVFSAAQIEARFDWFSLLSGQLSATQLVATTPVFQPIEDPASGQWNYERLRPDFGSTSSGSAKGVTLPVIVLRDAHVKFGQLVQGRVQQTAETVIDGEMTPDSALTSTYHFRFAQSDPIPAQGPAAPAGAVLRGTWDSAHNIFKLTSENIVMTDTLRNSLPHVARQWCLEHQLSGRLSRLDLGFTPRAGVSVTVNFDGVGMMWMVEPEPGIGVGDVRPAYPLDLRNVRGQVVFAQERSSGREGAGDDAPERDPNTIRIADLRGEVLGYQFLANGTVQGASADAPFAFTVQFPDAVVGDRYPPLFMASLSSQDLMQRMEPHGRMDILVNLRRETPGGDVLYDGHIDLHDARLRYAHFPAPLDHVNGRLTFDQRSVTFSDFTGKKELSGKADEMDVFLSGTCGTVSSNRLVDVTIRSPNILVDERLGACLPQEYQEVWNLLSLRGQGSLVCRVTRSDAVNDRQKLVVDLDLRDTAGYLHAFPYAFSQAAGRLHLEGDGARIEHFTARTGADGSGRVTIDGVVRSSGGDVANLQPELRIVADVPVDTSLIRAFSEEQTSWLAGVDVGGRLGFDGTVRRTGEPGGPSVQVAGNLDWKQGTLQTTYREQVLSFTSVSAQGALTPTTVDIKNLAATLDSSPQKMQVGLSGKLDYSGTTCGLLHVTIAGNGLDLPVDAPLLFPESWRDMWRAHTPAGVVDLSAQADVRVNLPADPAAAQPEVRLSDTLALETYAARLTLHNGSLLEHSWPDSPSKINGTLDVAPSGISMTGMTASLGNVDVAWSGHTDLDAGKITLAGQADAKGLPKRWMQYVPDAIVQRLDPKADAVTLSLRLDSLTRAAPDKPWAFQGKLLTTNLATIGTLAMTSQQADFSGKGFLDPATSRFDFNGNLNIAKLTVSNRLVDSLTADLTADGESHDITISNMEGKVAGGNLEGAIRIHSADDAAAAGATSAAATPAVGTSAATSIATLPAAVVADGGYVANLVLHDADLARLILSDQATNEERKTVGTGRVTASLSLQENFGPHPDRTGRGELVILNGEIYNVPLSMGLMQVATLRLPVANSFRQASTSYYLRNDEITFERILLESKGINLAGMGTVSIADRQLDMSFITESPNEINIPILTPITREIRNGILELSVSGTLDKPEINPVPLSAISNLLRSLLPQAQSRAAAR
jgi:hypothetical protein